MFAVSRIRPAALTAVAAAALFAGAAQAQSSATAPPAGGKPPAAAAATSSKPETVEQRIQMLKTALRITPEQEPKWTAVATTMRDNAGRMEKLVAEKRRQAPEKTTAVEDLRTYQDFAQAHLEGIERMTSAFQALYDTMTPEQRKNADTVFENYGPGRKAGSQG